MKILRGLEIIDAIETMNSILVSTDLTDDPNSYDYLLSFDDIPDREICLISKDNKSFLFGEICRASNKILVKMFAGQDGKMSFSTIFEYITTIKDLLDNRRDIRIIADFRVSTSLPLMKRLIKRYGMEIDWMDDEIDGYCTMSVSFDPER